MTTTPRIRPATDAQAVAAHATAQSVVPISKPQPQPQRGPVLPGEPMPPRPSLMTMLPAVRACDVDPSMPWSSIRFESPDHQDVCPATQTLEVLNLIEQYLADGRAFTVQPVLHRIDIDQIAHPMNRPLGM